MNSFTIAQLAQFSGIKPHTIRMWEHRYQVLSPQRTSGNVRVYSGEDLRRLLNIVSLHHRGYKLAELGEMEDQVLDSLIQDQYDLNKQTDANPFVFQLLTAGLEFDEIAFDKTLSHCILRFGMHKTYVEIIYPLVNRMGLMWASDILPPVQEHFMSNLLRQKILTAIDSLPPPRMGREKWLLFLPEDEYHEIGLLLAHYQLRNNGMNSIYLGVSVPLLTLQTAIESIGPDCLLLFFVHRDLPENANYYISQLRNVFQEGAVYLSGNEQMIEQLRLDENTKWLRSTDDLEAEIRLRDVK